MDKRMVMLAVDSARTVQSKSQLWRYIEEIGISPLLAALKKNFGEPAGAASSSADADERDDGGGAGGSGSGNAIGAGAGIGLGAMADAVIDSGVLRTEAVEAILHLMNVAMDLVRGCFGENCKWLSWRLTDSSVETQHSASCAPPWRGRGSSPWWGRTSSRTSSTWWRSRCCSSCPRSSGPATRSCSTGRSARPSRCSSSWCWRRTGGWGVVEMMMGNACVVCCLLVLVLSWWPAAQRKPHRVIQLIQEDGRLWNALQQMTAEGMYAPVSPTYAACHKLLAAIGTQERSKRRTVVLHSLTCHQSRIRTQGTTSGGPSSRASGACGSSRSTAAGRAACCRWRC